MLRSVLMISFVGLTQCIQGGPKNLAQFFVRLNFIKILTDFQNQNQ